MRKPIMAALVAALACVLLTPVSASADLADDAPPPPRYALEDGFLVVDGDQFIECRSFLLTEEDSKVARLCTELGFSLGEDASATAAPEAASATASATASAAGTSSAGSPGTTSASAQGEGELPETGGPVSLMALASLALLVGSGITAFGIIRRS